MTKPYSDEIIAGIDQLEEKYDIELVSIDHHQEWVDRCEHLVTQRDELLIKVKQAVAIMSQKPDEYGLFVQGGIDVLVAAIAAEEGDDANTAATDPPERPPTCQHETPRKLSYHGDQRDARRRLARGEARKFCHVCERWVWGEYWWKDDAP